MTKKAEGPAIFVFVMTGCGACHEFMPKFIKATSGLQGVSLYRGDIAKDKKAAAWADHFGITATPTTVAVNRRGEVRKTVGAVDVNEIGMLTNFCVK